MSDGDTMIARRSDRAVCRIIDDEVVILIPEQQVLYALGGCGSRVWELIDGKATVSEIINIIYEEYEVELQRAREDVIEFINDLSKLNLVEVTTGVNKEVGH